MKGGVLAIIVFSILSFFVSGSGPTDEIKVIISISTFVFSILAGFSISRLTERYNDLRNLIAEEDSLLLSIYKTSCLYGEGFSNKIRDSIDKFYIISFNYPFKSIKVSYKEVTPLFLQIFDDLKPMMRQKNQTPLASVLRSLPGLERVRNQISVRLQDKITRSKWFLLLTLASIIIFSVYFTQGDAYYYKLISVALSSAIVVILLIIRDYNNMETPGKLPLFESGQENLEAMDLKRYYPIGLKDRVPKGLKGYRVGVKQEKEKKVDLRYTVE